MGVGTVTGIVTGIVTGLVLLVVFFWIRSVSRRADAMFNPAHVIEFAEILRRLKTNAIEQPWPPSDTPDLATAPTAETSAGICVLWTCTDNEATGSEHHVSLSKRDSHITNYSLKRLAKIVVALNGLRGFADHVEMGVSDHPVLHISFSVQADRRTAYAAHSIRALTEPEADELIAWSVVDGTAPPAWLEDTTGAQAAASSPELRA